VVVELDDHEELILDATCDQFGADPFSPVAHLERYVCQSRIAPERIEDALMETLRMHYLARVLRPAVREVAAEYGLNRFDGQADAGE